MCSSDCSISFISRQKCKKWHNFFLMPVTFGAFDAQLVFPYLTKIESLKKIMARLDRGVANQGWIARFPDFKVVHITRLLSDHSAIQVFWKSPKPSRKSRGREKLFRFEERWLHETTCNMVIREAWSGTGGTSSSSVPGRIQQCNRSLSEWDRKHFGDIPKQIEKCTTDLSNLQRQSPTVGNLQAIRSLENKIAALLRKEEIFWHQRSRICWTKEGDEKHEILSSNCKW